VARQRGAGAEAPARPIQARIAVDWLRCRGHGICAGLLPEVITLDDWGYPFVHAGVPRPLHGTAVRTVAACPALALELLTE